MNTLDKPLRLDLNRGFTLIELMIAIAIVGVLAAIAVPAYSNYLARARISEAVNYAQSCKTGYVEFYATNGRRPANVNESNCPDVDTENIASVQVLAGANPQIIVNLVNAAPLPTDVRGHRIVLQPLNTTGTLLADGQRLESWRCSLTTSTSGNANTAAMDYVPAACRQNRL
ncbi:pilin [Limnobacter sp.]|uniref:pilin n=1 Tax=Limnobacter sp. TaxID=2003368 RepID=UPI003518997E